jgi:hypothetical protein
VKIYTRWTWFCSSFFFFNYNAHTWSMDMPRKSLKCSRAPIRLETLLVRLERTHNLEQKREDRKKWASWEAKSVPLERSWLYGSENRVHHPQETNFSTKRCIWRYTIKPWLKICHIVNHLVESQFFPSPLAFRPWAHSNECCFHVFIPGQTPILLLESESGFEFVTQIKNPGKLIGDNER